jgi:hypothetical protein
VPHPAAARACAARGAKQLCVAQLRARAITPLGTSAPAPHPAGRCCIDVGCGAGLAGLALAAAGARLAVLADGDAGAAANCARNARLNGVRGAAAAPDVWAAHTASTGAGAGGLAAGGERSSRRAVPAVACCRMVWEEAAPEDGEPARPLPAFDAVVASDVLYDPVCVPPFVRLLRRLLDAGRRRGGGGGGGSGRAAAAHDEGAAGQDGSSGGGGEVVAYVATTRRNPRTLELFEAAAAGAGLRLEALPTGPWPGAPAFQAAAPLRGRAGILLHRITVPA